MYNKCIAIELGKLVQSFTLENVPKYTPVANMQHVCTLQWAQVELSLINTGSDIHVHVHVILYMKGYYSYTYNSEMYMHFTYLSDLVEKFLADF